MSVKRKHHAVVPNEASPFGQPASKRRNSQGIGTKVHEDQNSPGSTLHASEAREYIEHELQCNPALSHDRRTALETARNFVNQLSNPGLHRRETDTAESFEAEDGLKSPTLTPELLYMMLPGKCPQYQR